MCRYNLNYRWPRVINSKNPILKQKQFLTHLSISALGIVSLECILRNIEKGIRQVFSPTRSDTLFFHTFSQSQWPSPPGTFHILIGKFSYFIIRFLNQIFLLFCCLTAVVFPSQQIWINKVIDLSKYIQKLSTFGFFRHFLIT